MLKVKKIHPTEYVSQPWKNGRGRTTQIDLDSETPFRWRISRAQLQESGPFSSFPGYTRNLVLLNGSVKWKEGSKPMSALPLFVTKTFPGEMPVECQVLTPGEDFNLFCLKDRARGNCYPTLYRKGEEMHLPLRGQEHFLYVVSGRIEVQERNTGQKLSLATNDTVRFTRPPEKEYFDIKTIGIDPSRAIWVVIHLSP